MSQPRRYQAPRQHGSFLAVPALEEAGRLLAANRDNLARVPSALLGRPLSQLRDEARQSLLAAARSYFRDSGEPLPDLAHPDSLLISGHQPELFHPGVWVKNFAINGLARIHRATPVNLIIDSDTVKATALKVPEWSSDPAAVQRVPVAFDRLDGEAPYEERMVLDEALFADFPEHVSAHTGRWPFRPMLPAFWQEVLQQARRTRVLGERFVAARRGFERRWGCRNLEVPIHALCQTEPFAWFACHLLADLPRFHRIYNECVQDYRRRHGIRSRSHPVPDLAEDNGWLETPFFAWKAGATRRGRLLARPARDSVALRIDKAHEAMLPLGNGAVAAWLDLERQGLKVRSRALTTMMYARLLLADLFVHGIGGAKYDELTDDILRRFFDMEPPAILVLSATLRLPFPAFPSSPDDCRLLARRLRDLQWNPQRHLDKATGPAMRELAAEKQAWVDRQPADHAGRKQRFQTLQALTRQLKSHLAEEEQGVGQALERCRQEVEANAVSQNREYAFCLYPEEMLRTFYQRFLEPA